jgi:hypothetical protein
VGLENLIMNIDIFEEKIFPWLSVKGGWAGKAG